MQEKKKYDLLKLRIKLFEEMDIVCTVASPEPDNNKDDNELEWDED